MAKRKPKEQPAASPTARPARRWWKRLGVAILALLVLSVLGIVLARATLALRVHITRPPLADLSHELQQAIQKSTDGKTPGDMKMVIDLAVQVTRQHLRYGKSHTTRLRFDVPVREGNSIEYSTLFASVFNQLSRWAKLGASAAIVHSAEGRVLGVELPTRWVNHEWVVIDVGKSGPRFYVDPTLGAYHLGWNLEGNVEGDVPKPY